MNEKGFMKLNPIEYGTENEINMGKRVFNVYELKVSLAWDRYVYRIVKQISCSF
jgi:hypothetical protein